MASSLPPGFEGAVLGSLPVNHHIPQTNVPKTARVSKKVSWANEDSLCQVRLFAAEDPCTQSTSTRQDMLLPKKAKFMHMVNPVAHADLPPGFGPSAQIGLKPAVVTIVPQMPWRIPERYKLDPGWLVMAGGESKEVYVQKQRENRTLEAVYPRPSAIPESPAEPSEPQFRIDETDAHTLIIPVVPLEDDDSPDPDDAPTTSGSAYEILEEYSFPREKAVSPPPGFNLTSILSKPRNWVPEAPQEKIPSLPALSSANILGPHVNIPPSANGIATQMTTNSRTGSLAPPARTPSEGTVPDVAAAAAAAYAALSQANDTTMIDRELLIKFLTNPSMLQNLSEKLAQNPPGVVSEAKLEAGRRNWNVATENKGGQRYVDCEAYDRPPGFGAFVPSQALPQQQPVSPPAVVSGTGRQRDEYWKDLISQHGKNEETPWGGGTGDVVETETSYGGRPSSRANGSDRNRKMEKADRSERAERLDSGPRWAADRDADMMESGGRPGEESRSGQSRGKSRKACIYFTTSRGCRNGSSCPFIHESNSSERTKRPKLEGKESSKGYRYSS